jgi:hypothetical protein
MEFGKQSVLDLVKQQGGDHEAAAQLPDKVDHDDHASLLQKFGPDPDDLISKVGGSSHLGC